MAVKNKVKYNIRIRYSAQGGAAVRRALQGDEPDQDGAR